MSRPSLRCASHKLHLRGYPAAIAVFCDEVKGKSALALSRDLGSSSKSAFVLLHKLCEAMVPVHPRARPAIRSRDNVTQCCEGHRPILKSTLTGTYHIDRCWPINMIGRHGR
jgi:hypothetical protein